MRAFSSSLLSPVHPFVSPSISTNWINRSQRCTVARRTAWRARTCTHIAPTDPHELHISSLHMNAARRPDPPGRNILPRAMSRAIYVRLCRCARECAHVRFCGTGGARREWGRTGREGRKEKGMGSLGCDHIRQIAAFLLTESPVYDKRVVRCKFLLRVSPILWQKNLFFHKCLLNINLFLFFY